VPFSYGQEEWKIPELRTWYQTFTATRKLIRYDNRGTGLSDRDIEAHSVRVLADDLEAVIQELGLERFALLGMGHSGPVSIEYSIRHPEQVARLILWCSYARANEYLQLNRAQQLQDALVGDQSLAAQALVGVIAGSASQRLKTQLAELYTKASSAQYFALRRRTPPIDVTEQLGAVSVPTLVMYRPDFALRPESDARELARGIPNARLMAFSGDSSLWFDDPTITAALHSFLDGDFDPRDRASPVTTGVGFHAILFTDIEAHTAMMQRLGDARGREVLREHERITREALRAHGGTEIKTIGDSFMASFRSAQEAVECAIALQRAFALRQASGTEPLRIRVGINAGEPIAEEGDLFGSSVILAARTKEKAQGGQILVTDVVRQLVLGNGFLFAGGGEEQMRGFDEPTRLYEVLYQPA
jgi:class 3 adenylate cyclase